MAAVEIAEIEEAESEVPETEVPETEVVETEVAADEMAETEEAETEVPQTEVAETEVAEIEEAETEEAETEVEVETGERGGGVPKPFSPIKAVAIESPIEHSVEFPVVEGECNVEPGKVLSLANLFLLYKSESEGCPG